MVAGVLRVNYDARRNEHFALLERKINFLSYD